MDDSYLIKIESVVLSDGLLTELANVIDKIYDEVKTSSSSLVDYTFKTKHGQETTIHTKEECSKQKIPKDLAEIKFYFYSNNKNVRVSIHIGLMTPDSQINVSSDDKIWNRGVAILLKEIIDEHARKFNKWIRKWSSKFIVGLSILGLVYSIYYVISLFIPNDSHSSTLNNSQYLMLVLNLISWLYVYPSLSSVLVLSFFFPVIEHKKMLRVRIRKYVGLLMSAVIVGIFVEIFTKSISNIFF